MGQSSCRMMPMFSVLSDHVLARTPMDQHSPWQRAGTQRARQAVRQPAFPSRWLPHTPYPMPALGLPWGSAARSHGSVRRLGKRLRGRRCFCVKVSQTHPAAAHTSLSVLFRRTSQPGTYEHCGLIGIHEGSMVCSCRRFCSSRRRCVRIFSASVCSLAVSSLALVMRNTASSS